MTRHFFASILALLATLSGACASSEPASEAHEAPDEDEFIGSARPIFTPPSAESATRAKYPFVLVHAFHGSATSDWSFDGVKEALEAHGHFVVPANISPYQTTPKRAEQLTGEIDRARRDFCAARRADADPSTCFNETKVNLIGHSQGGLDARWAVGKLGYGPHVATVTTLGAPHRGTPIGDVGLKVLRNPLVPERLANAFFELLGERRTTSELAADPNVTGAIYWLSEERARNAEDEITDDPSVHYEAWAGYASTLGRVDAGALSEACEHKVFGEAKRTAQFAAFPFRSAHFIVLAGAFDGRLNDGHIPIESARGPLNSNAHWVFRGCVPADHLDLIGRPSAEQSKASRRTGFRHVDFFQTIAHELASRHGA
jgi:triacylglycerol esterase/lipase EstA (alpha/beta hydrolase family)